MKKPTTVVPYNFGKEDREKAKDILQSLKLQLLGKLY